MAKFVNRHQETKVEPVVTRIAEEDRWPWYRKPNLRHLYLLVFLYSSTYLYKLWSMVSDDDSSSPRAWASS